LKSLKKGVNRVGNRVRVWNLAERAVARIGRLREELGGDELSLKPSKKERRSKGSIKYETPT
jgi:hypothetical protein